MNRVEQRHTVNTMTTIRERLPLPEDLRVFLEVIRCGRFAGAARSLGVSPAYVSKRIGVLEASLGARLFHRNGAHGVLTEDGEITRRAAEQVLDQLGSLSDALSDARRTPSGRVAICSSFGFGRTHVAPAIARLAEAHPELELRLDLFDRAVDLVGEGFDLEVRVGDDLPGQHISRRLISNQRVLCAAPDYLRRRGTPKTLDDLARHDCLVIKERDNAFGIWDLERRGEIHRVRISGPLSSNSGEIVLQWAVQGRGILLRSIWDVGPMLRSGALVRVLPQHGQRADVWAIYPQRLALSARLRVCVEFLERHFSRLGRTDKSAPA